MQIKRLDSDFGGVIGGGLCACLSVLLEILQGQISLWQMTLTGAYYFFDACCHKFWTSEARIWLRLVSSGLQEQIFEVTQILYRHPMLFPADSSQGSRLSKISTFSHKENLGGHTYLSIWLSVHSLRSVQ